MITLSSTAAEASVGRLGERFYCLDANIAQPVRNEIVGVGEAVARIKGKIIDKYLACVVGKVHTPRAVYAIVFTVDMEG
jgi:hypothetical protein